MASNKHREGNLHNQELGLLIVHTIVLLKHIELLLNFELLLKKIPSVILITRCLIKLLLDHLEPEIVLADVVLAHVAKHRPLRFLFHHGFLKLLLFQALLFHSHAFFI